MIEEGEVRFLKYNLQSDTPVLRKPSRMVFSKRVIGDSPHFRIPAGFTVNAIRASFSTSSLTLRSHYGHLTLRVKALFWSRFLSRIMLSNPILYLNKYD